MTWKNSRSGPAPSMIAASSSSRGMVAMKARKSRIVKRQPVGDLDQDHAVHGLEQAEALQHPDGRHHGGRDDQAGEHQEVDDRASSATGRRCSTKPTMAPKTTSSVTLATVRMIELMKAVTQHVVAGLDDLDEIVPEVPVGRPVETSAVAACRRSLTAVRTMKANGTRKTTIETRIAMPPTM